MLISFFVFIGVFSIFRLLKKYCSYVLIKLCPLGGMVDTADLKSAGASRAGSSPVVGSFIKGI